MIFINDIPSLRNPESFSYNFDHRIEKIELINGTVAQDYGHIESGDSFSLSCVFSVANYQRLKALWLNRQFVSFTDEAGTVFYNLRLVFKSIKRVAHFPNYVTLDFDLWRC